MRMTATRAVVTGLRFALRRAREAFRECPHPPTGALRRRAAGAPRRWRDCPRDAGGWGLPACLSAPRCPGRL